MEHEKIPFVCRICGHDSYGIKYLSDDIDRIVHYTCAGCGVHFQDPARFSLSDSLAQPVGHQPPKQLVGSQDFD